MSVAVFEAAFFELVDHVLKPCPDVRAVPKRIYDRERVGQETESIVYGPFVRRAIDALTGCWHHSSPRAEQRRSASGGGTLRSDG
jgi:hypothetical protein